MHQLIELYKQKHILHHSYLFIGHELHEIVDKLKHFFENHLSFKTTGNPDFWHKKFDTLTIDDARELTDREGIKAVGNSRKIFIIETNFITEEAQNSLLKVFEEPISETHFFVVTSQDILLPTLRSRMQVILDSQNEDKINKTSLVLNLSLKERLELVKELTNSISEDDKTKQDAISFVNQIEKELYVDGIEKNAKKIEICENTRNSLFDRGAPVKMILENLMLNV